MGNAGSRCLIVARNPPPIRGEEFWNPFAARFVGVGVALTVGSPK